MKAFAIDDLIINEEGGGGNNISALQQVTGLAESKAQMATRYGRRPVIAGLQQSARRIFLEAWLHGDDQDANRQLLLQYLNTDKDTIRRLIAADNVPPAQFGNDLLLVLGPWDVYEDDGGDWHVRDILQPDDVEADISGAVHFVSGARSSGTLRSAATVNYVTNPVAGGASGYDNYNGGVLARSDSYYKFDTCTEYSYVLTLDDSSEGGRWDLETLSGGMIYYVSFWLYSEDVAGTELQVSLDGGSNWSDLSLLSTSGDWSRYGAAVSITSGTDYLYIRINAPISSEYPDPEWTVTDGDEWTITDGDEWTYWESDVTAYIDGLQVEWELTPSALRWGGQDDYGWSGTAHNSATELPQAVTPGTAYSDEARAIAIEEATTNLVKNPVAGRSGYWGTYFGSVGLSRDVYLFGPQKCYSFKVTVSSGFHARWSMAAAANAIHYVTFWQYGQAPNPLQVSLDNSNWHDVDLLIAEGGWARYGAQIPAAQANSATYLHIRQSSAGAGTYYLDGLQVEEKLHPTTLCYGNLGPGYSWDGTAHSSKSSRTVTQLELDDEIDLIDENDAWSIFLRVQMPYDADGDWPDEAFLFDARGASNNHRVYLEFEDSDDKLHVYVNGGDRFQSSAQSFSAGDWLSLALTLDFDGEARLYVDGERDGCGSISSLDAPTLTDWMIGSDYSGSNQANAAVIACLAYDRVLTCSEVNLLYNSGVWGLRWLDVMAEAVQPRRESGRVIPNAYVTTLVIDDDTRWRSRDGDLASWRIYDADEDLRVTVDSEDDVYPEYRITPVTAKSSGFEYKRWVPIVWNASRSATTYPVCIEPPDLSSEAQADGDDVRVYVGGVEVDRWLGGTLVSDLKVWINLDFEPEVSGTLGEAIGAGDTVTEVVASTDISDFPVAGILLIDDEAFVYTGKSTATKTFTGVTRAARGTSAAAHTTSDTIYWIQHDVYLYYGDASLSAPSVDGDYEPVFEVDDSDNGSWVYEEFGEDDGLRAGQWQTGLVSHDGEVYGGNQGATANPWIELGLMADSVYAGPHWYGDTWRYVYNPCGITDIHLQNGEKWASVKGVFWGDVGSSIDGQNWTVEYTVPDPSADSTWESWSYGSTSITSGSLYVRLRCREFSSSRNRLEIADATLTIGDNPTVEVGDEQSNYSLDCTISNEITGNAIAIATDIGVDDTIVVDTRNKLVRLNDGTRLLNAITKDSARLNWLRLLPGVNDLNYTESNALGVEVEILWTRRGLE